MQRITLQAVQGGIRVVTGGQTSTTIVEGSFPSCTVSVFNTGTVNLATIFGDNLSPPTPKSNPFTADTSGFAFFYAANGSRVDVQLSGTGITVPFLVASDILVDDGTLLTTIAPQTVAFSATPTFDLSQASWFKLTLTGNVTVPAFTNPQTGSLLLLSLTQNAAGGNTFAWPAAFLHPPTIASAANAVTELIFKYDGVNWRSVAATGDNLQVPTNANIIGILVVQGASTLASLTVTANALIGGTLNVTGNTVLGSALNVTGAITAGSYTNNLSAFAATTSAQLKGVISDETGSGGGLVFATAPALASPVLTTPVITGTPTGTGIPTVTLKKGSGAGNYTTASTGFVQVDAANLLLTVTIPVGWKLTISAGGDITSNTAAVLVVMAIADGGVVIVESAVTPSAATVVSRINLVTAITGDGASHTVDLRFRTTNAADSAVLTNITATLTPTMVFLLTPSN